ncbi:hypothetical protein BH11VER1_BH11VER1_13170 [soil metagenome]
MNASATLGVLNDVFLLAGLVLLAGMIVYAIIRSQTSCTWNYEGNVLTRPYGFHDALVALGVIILFGWSSLQIDSPEKIATSPPAESLSPAFELILGVSMLVFFSILLMLYMRMYREMDPAEMFGLRSLSIPSALGVSILSFLAVWLVIIVSVNVMKTQVFGGAWPDESSQAAVETFRKTGSPLYKVLLGIVAVFIAPLMEEIIFRGFLYGVVKRFTDRWFAMFFTALFFAAVHQHVGSLFPLFLLAMGLAIAYEATGCLFVPIFMHALFNAYNIGAMLLQ